MAETFGARVRKHREQQGISLESIAIRTKIKASLLAGLERDDIAQWPPGIFRRAYARAYAEAIGLDVDGTVREFLALYPDPVEALPPPPPEQQTGLRRLLESTLELLSRQRRRHTAAPEPEPASTRAAELTARPALVDAPRPVATTHSVAPIRPLEEPQPAERQRLLEETPPEERQRLPAVQPSDAPHVPVVAASAPEAESAVDLVGAARLCTRIGCVTAVSELVPLLRDGAKVLGARGLIVWTSDATTGKLRPTIVHGYPDKVRARLRPVNPGDDNATAAAFRSMEMRAVASRETGRSALAVPLLSAAGCAGVLAIELSQDRAEIPAVQAMATFIAAVLAQLIAGPDAADREAERRDSGAPGGQPRGPRSAARGNGVRTA